MFALVASSAMAQLASDAILFNRTDYNGTARLQAMGGAFGALGADLSASAINPAGVASYRSTEVGFTLGVNAHKMSTDTYGFGKDETKVSCDLDQMGLVYAFEVPSKDVTHAFLINYTQLADYDYTAKYRDEYEYNSILDYMCIYPSNPFLGDLGYRANVMGDQSQQGDEVYDITHNIWEVPVGNQVDAEGREYADGGPIDHFKHVKERGSKGEFTFAYAANIYQKVYLGATIGVQSFSRSSKTLLTENFYGEILSFEKSGDIFYDEVSYGTSLHQDAAGVNFAFGMIVRPIPQLRIGAAIHSPTFFSVEEDYSADILAIDNETYFSKSAYSGEYEYEYRYYTPGRLNVSVAGVFADYGIISMDYEYSNYANSKFKEKEDDLDAESRRYIDAANDEIDNLYKASHTLRMGAEVKVIDQLALRAGFGIQSSPYEDGFTVNDYKHSTVSGGIGYRSTNFFLDFTYVNAKNQFDYWVLPDDGPGTYPYRTNEPSNSELTSHNFVLTLGFRF